MAALIRLFLGVSGTLPFNTCEFSGRPPALQNSTAHIWGAIFQRNIIGGPAALLRRAQDWQPAAGTNVAGSNKRIGSIRTSGRRGRRPSRLPRPIFGGRFFNAALLEGRRPRRPRVRMLRVQTRGSEALVQAAGPPGIPRQNTGYIPCREKLNE